MAMRGERQITDRTVVKYKKHLLAFVPKPRDRVSAGRKQPDSGRVRLPRSHMGKDGVAELHARSRSQFRTAERSGRVSDDGPNVGLSCTVEMEHASLVLIADSGTVPP